MGTTISFLRPDGKKVDGYLAEPKVAATAAWDRGHSGMVGS